MAVSRVPKTTLRLNDSLGEFSTQQQIVILMLMIYYNERIQSKISKGREQMEQVQSPKVLFEWATQDVLNSSSEELGDPVKCCLAGKLTTDSTPRDLTGGWPCQHLCLVHTKIPESQEENQILSIIHIVCMNSLAQ